MLVVDKSKYNMAIYKDKKEVHVQILGFIKDDMVAEYVADLQATVAQVPKNEYSFVVDATYQSPLPAKAATNLGDTMMTYTTFGFKQIFIVNPKSKIAFVQIRNALEPKNFPGKLVNHLSETTNQ